VWDIPWSHLSSLPTVTTLCLVTVDALASGPGSTRTWSTRRGWTGSALTPSSRSSCATPGTPDGTGNYFVTELLKYGSPCWCPWMRSGDLGPA
jgi:hypothetical protein